MNKLLIYTISFFSFFCFFSCTASPEKAENLLCEHLVNPLGVDCAKPRLSWQLPAVKNNIFQSAYRIMLSADSAELGKDNAGTWDSGKVLSDSILIVYNGKSLQPFTRYYWTITYWNQDGKQSEKSAIASFETGIMMQKNWKGDWISDGKSVDYKPASYFRKGFSTSKKVKSARIYTAAAGLFELSVNGEKVSDEMLNPMYTNFEKRNLYVSYDITAFLQNGENTVGVLLGNGWYNHQSIAVWFFDRASWRNRPRFRANINIVYEDESSEVIASDSTWRFHDSPLIFNSIYTAEHYDMRKEIPGWDKANFNDKNWQNAVVVKSPSDNVVSQQLYPIRVTDTLRVEKMVKISDKHYVFHFRRNIAGTVKIKAKGEAGTVLKIRHAELLDENGVPNMANIDYHYRPVDDSDPFQTDVLILSGKEDTFTPKFNYKGFQYVDVIASNPITLDEKSIVALEMHSDVPSVGSISSSNPTLNKIWEASNSSYLANLFGYPTDCPQREKNGWTGDAHIAIETALYNFDGITIYEKWMNDFLDMQKPNGVLPCIIPTSVWGFDFNWGNVNGIDWSSAATIIPWKVYQFYGDSRLLETMYPAIKKLVNYVTSISPNGLTDWGLGDWIPVKTKSNLELTTSLYYYADAVILAKSAALFNKTEDAAIYSKLAEKIKNAINAKFLNTETGIYAGGSQTELSAPLYWGVVPENMKVKVAENLYKKVATDNFHLDVGLLGTKTILNALSENGYADAAYKIAAQETYPSWGYWMVNGATTFWENWKKEAVTDASHNHIMFGEVNAWFYKGLGGIFSDENRAGFKHIALKPNFVEGLEKFEAKHRSPYGWIISKWEQKGKKVKYTVVVPPNSTATLELPDNIENRKVIKLNAGQHSFSFTKKQIDGKQ